MCDFMYLFKFIKVFFIHIGILKLAILCVKNQI
jgi:hypothetical protein